MSKGNGPTLSCCQQLQGGRGGRPVLSCCRQRWAGRPALPCCRHRWAPGPRRPASGIGFLIVMERGLLRMQSCAACVLPPPQNASRPKAPRWRFFRHALLSPPLLANASLDLCALPVRHSFCSAKQGMSQSAPGSPTLLLPPCLPACAGGPPAAGGEHGVPGEGARHLLGRLLHHRCVRPAWCTHSLNLTLHAHETVLT